jgi:hypothetical protein
MSDRSWDDVVNILDKSSDYKLINSSQCQEAVIRGSFMGSVIIVARGVTEKLSVGK